MTWSDILFYHYFAQHIFYMYMSMGVLSQGVHLSPWEVLGPGNGSLCLRDSASLKWQNLVSEPGPLGKILIR